MLSSILSYTTAYQVFAERYKILTKSVIFTKYMRGGVHMSLSPLSSVVRPQQGDPAAVGTWMHDLAGAMHKEEHQVEQVQLEHPYPRDATVLPQAASPCRRRRGRHGLEWQARWRD